MNTTIGWDAITFFKTLTETNKLCLAHNFKFRRISGLNDFADAVATMQSTANFVCVSDVNVGRFELNNTPHLSRSKTVIIAMRHKMDDMVARQNCFTIINEIYRQFCSALIREKTKIEENNLYLESSISVQETDRNFIPGTAVCFFECKVTNYVDMQFHADEWTTSTPPSGIIE